MKNIIREEARGRLFRLSSQRREEALHALENVSLPPGNILSFANLPYELPLERINQKLAKEKRLLLPKIVGDHIVAYHVQDFQTLRENHFHIKEPDPERCPLALHIAAILVPALAFDSAHHRLGHGKGFYDRFLPLYPDIPHIGLGFREQLIEKVPWEAHDYPLSCVVFF